MRATLTALAVGANIGTLAGLWLAVGETPSEFAPALTAVTATLSLIALATKAGAR